MTKKLLLTIGYLVVAAVSGFALVLSILALTGVGSSDTSMTVAEMILFIVAFSLLFLSTLAQFIRQVIRIVIDIRINKENK